jgi:hypothetical protein
MDEGIGDLWSTFTPSRWSSGESVPACSWSPMQLPMQSPQVADAVAGAAAVEVETLASGEQVASGWQRKDGGPFLCSRVL